MIYEIHEGGLWTAFYSRVLQGITNYGATNSVNNTLLALVFLPLALPGTRTYLTRHRSVILRFDKTSHRGRARVTAVRGGTLRGSSLYHLAPRSFPPNEWVKLPPVNEIG